MPKIRKLAGDGADLNSRPQVPTLTHSLLTESIASNGMNRCSPFFSTARYNFLCIIEQSLLFSSLLLLTMVSASRLEKPESLP